MYDFESHIVDIPDYPEPGVVFKDITPLFGLSLIHISEPTRH